LTLLRSSTGIGLLSGVVAYDLKSRSRRSCIRRNWGGGDGTEGGSERLGVLEGAMQGESLLVIVVVGIVAGWLAGQIVRGTGYGLLHDLIIGVVGAFIGGWLLPRLNIHLGAGLIAAIVNATVGAVVLLLVLRLVRGGGRWNSGWGWRR
jgi:uncharacterized membrane protein YeaQ/YmgE (transglycosylase-associated protein family)